MLLQEFSLFASLSGKYLVKSCFKKRVFNLRDIIEVIGEQINNTNPLEDYPELTFLIINNL